MSFYLALKVVHVVAAIVAVGGNVTYSFWLRRAGRDRDRLLFVLESVRRFDRRIANPAYVVVLLSGLAMVATLPWPITQLWLSLALVLYVGIVVTGITVYAPAVRRQVAEAQRDPDSPAYALISRRTTALGVAVTLTVLVIVVLMITKPV